MTSTKLNYMEDALIYIVVITTGAHTTVAAITITITDD